MFSLNGSYDTLLSYVSAMLSELINKIDGGSNAEQGCFMASYLKCLGFMGI